MEHLDTTCSVAELATPIFVVQRDATMSIIVPLAMFSVNRRSLGVEMGAPWHLHKAMFEKSGVIVRSSNYSLYGDMSARVMKTLGGFTPDLEVYSIDEAFLSLRGFESMLDAHARDLRRTVIQWTGIPVSVGIGPTKILAKVANLLLG
jgi:DNA polymerase V